MSRPLRRWATWVPTVMVAAAALTACSVFPGAPAPTTAAPASISTGTDPGTASAGPSVAVPPTVEMPSAAMPSAEAVPSAGVPSGTATGPAAEALRRLPVAAWASGAGYSRDAFGQRWSDDVDVAGGHNGCDQRSDILRRDLVDVVLKARTQGCVPATGTLYDPYTGSTIGFVRGQDTSAEVQIDHVVALSNAWRTGAQEWTAQRRQDFAGDPLELLAVGGATNQAKGDDDAAGWQPPLAAFRCTYVARQVGIKTAYHLWVTPDEAAAMADTLTGCPGQPLPSGIGVPAPVR